MNWWYESRFGMFVHFGSYSYLAQGEWAMSSGWSKSDWQTKVTAKFNPTNFNGGTIARLAKSAGMKYLVITAKHHEGFSMWDTHVASFKDVTGTKDYDLPGYTAFNTRDILKELKDSCEAVGVKFCLYYSIIDWNHASQTSYNFTKMNSFEDRTAYIADMKAQLKELIDNYHPAILWFDGDWTYNSGAPTLDSWWTKSDGIDLYNYVTSLDPDILVNERVFRGGGLGDWMCPEQTIPATPEGRPWETCQTMNGSWGYNSGDKNYKTLTTLIQQLVQIASRDGNLLLNIGPKGDGTVPVETTNLLNQMGAWMDKNSASIYGTTRSPFTAEPAWGYYTKKNGNLFAHIFTWPDTKSIKIPSLKNKINKIYFLADTTIHVNYKDSAGFIRVSLPDKALDAVNTVLAIDVDGVPELSTDFVKISRITLTSSSSSITTTKGTAKITATIFPTNASNSTLRWSLSDSTLATLSPYKILVAQKNGSLTVNAYATDDSGVVGSVTIPISGQTTAVEIVSDSKMLVYPNPVKDGVLMVNLSDGIEGNIRICNISGQALISQKIKSKLQKLNVSGLAPGIYSVEVFNGQTSTLRQMVIVK
ncbi:MAG TPA: alpha-L-fucosidase [Paludibacter sp.]|nr:alpha-L-fucosidase [Paludibacter sp.]